MKATEKAAVKNEEAAAKAIGVGVEAVLLGLSTGSDRVDRTVRWENGNAVGVVEIKAYRVMSVVRIDVKGDLK